jgi:hypothetical protein
MQIGVQAPVDRRAARRPGRAAEIVGARELDRELVQAGAANAKRRSERRLGVLAQPAQPIHTDSVSQPSSVPSRPYLTIWIVRSIPS